MLSLLQEWLEATYRVQAPDVRDFVVDTAQLTELIGDAVRPAGEWVLVRQEGEAVDLAVWVAPDALARLEDAQSPREALDACFSALCAAVEGVSHFLLLVDRAKRAEPVRLLEMEAQAEIDKYICGVLHQPSRAREWHARIFRDASLQPGLDAQERERYLEAGRLAAGICRQLQRHPHPAALLDDLRRFWRMSGDGRMDRMRRLAA